ncbi:cellulose-binding protein [Streptomyces olivochromogenes]|nr:cellulose-binding protein [Streptomyces olivochromogenes]MCF3135359.1 cellulose-binding protein [Streptomyces olivochromogenes]
MPHGFETVRGRGYRPEQVDAYAEALARDRDAAWERAARLTVLAKDMEAEVEQLRETVAQLAPQTYETLGERAQRLFQLVVEEATLVRESVRRATQEEVAQAEARALSVRQAAQEYADALCAEAEERSRQRLLAAGAEADDLRIGARREVKEGRAEALAALREVRDRTSAMLGELAKEHAERWAEAKREVVGRAEAFDAEQAERLARAEAELAEAKRSVEQAEEWSRRCQHAARARAGEILTEARMQEGRIASDTQRVLREHGEQWDEVRAHMDHVRKSLTALTGRAPAE